MTYASDLKKTIFDWAKAESEYTTIWESSNASRPIKPYCSLNIQSLVPIGMLATYPAKDEFGVFIDGQVIIENHFNMVLAVNIFSDKNSQQIDAMTKLFAMNASLAKQSVRDAFIKRNIGYLDLLSQNNLTELLSTEYEQRAQMEILLSVGTSIIDDVGWIETVEIEGEINEKDVDFTVIQ